MQGPAVAQDIMVTNLVTLAPSMDVFDAIDLLLKNRVSGAPVIDDQGEFLGVFSEQSCLELLVDAAYEQLPSTQLMPFIETEAPTIAEDADLLTIARTFLRTTTRRLPVLRDGRLVGQISRRDVIGSAHKLMAVSRGKGSDLLYLSSLLSREEAPIK